MSFLNSLHGKMAIEAISRGKNARDLHGCSQEHANAAWLYAIAGSIIWYFFGWGWALIPFGFGIYAATQSISATLIAENIEALLKKP